MPEDEQASLDSTTSANKNPVRSIDIVKVIHDFEGDESTTLNLSINDTIHVLLKGNNGWWDGVIDVGGELTRGWFPASYVKSITTPSNFTSILKKSLSDPKVTTLSGNYSPSRRNSGTSVSSSVNDQDSVTTSITNENQEENEINILSADEVNSLCDRILSQTNEPPIWVPQLTDEGVLIYYNEKFNAYSRELPLTSSPKIDADSLLKFPQKSTLNNLNNVIIPKDMENQETLNYRPDVNLKSAGKELQQQERLLQPPSQTNTREQSQERVSTSKIRQGSAKSQQSFSVSGEHARSLNNALFSYSDLFYTDPTDMTTWVQLYKTFIYVVDVAINALTKNQTSLFLMYYNNITQLCTLFQLSARLIQRELQNQNLENSIQSKLKKMTNSVAELGINGDLHLTYMNRLENTTNDVSSNTSSIEEGFLEKARNNVKHLKNRAESCYKIFTSVKYDEPNHDVTLLPQIYPRFLKNVFDGGNWTNPLFTTKASPLEVDRKGQGYLGKIPRYLNKANRPKILLDKDALHTLEGKKAKLTQILGDIISTMDTTTPEGVDMLKFKDERNVTILTVVYNLLQPVARIMDILEAFDFSVFKAVRQIPSFKEQSSIPEHTVHESADPADNISQLDSAFFDKEIVSYTYPMLVEFFEFKQDLYDSITELVMDAQGLTLDDPEIFKGIREDDPIHVQEPQLETEKLAAKLKTLLIENDINDENNSRLQFQKDNKLRASIEKLGKSLGMVLYSVQQLISERESILNYTSRNMNIEFDISIFMGERHSTMPELIEDFRNDEVLHPQRMSKDVPWFLGIDDPEYNIVYDSKGNIKGGTIDALVCHLTSNGDKNPDFIGAFLMTFRSFITPIDLISKFEERYDLYPPEGLSFEEYNTWIEKKLKVVRINVMSCIWLLLTRYWNYFYYTEALMNRITKFIQRASDHIVPNKQDYYDKIKSLSEISKRRTLNSVGSSYKIETIPISIAPPPPIIKSNALRKLKLKDIDPLEMARQLSIREFAFYSKITELEFLDRIWGDKYSHLGSSTNIKFFISYANKLTNFISFMIIKHKDLKKRAETIVYFIKVCEKCLMLKNYSSLTAIISALSSSPIARLKKTWALVPKAITETFNRLDKLMSIDRNYNEYRDLLKFVKDNEPCIPFLGIYLTDLTFVTQAISDFIERDRQMINFYKRYKIYYTITDSLRYGKVPYNFQIVHEIQSFLDNWFSVSPDVNDQHKMSLILEPRMTPLVL